MKIVYPETPVEINVGDIVVAGNGHHLVVFAKADGVISEKLELVSLTSSKMYDHTTFNTKIHLLNHLKKHYKTNFKVIPRDKISLHIAE